MRGEDTSGSTGAIVLAAGQSQRFGVDKLFAPLYGKPVLQWTVESFLAAPSIQSIVLVLSEANFAAGRSLAESLGVADRIRLTHGGARRQDSVAAGLQLLDNCTWIVVHDGARPLVTPEIIERGLIAARETGAALAAVPVTDTIKEVDPQHAIVRTLDRSRLWAAQTPQVFRADLLRQAHAAATGDVTDDAMFVEQLGHRVVVFPGRTTNLKVTTPDDLALASALLATRGSPDRPDRLDDAEIASASARADAAVPQPHRTAHTP